ncbi:MAG: NAD/NADP octopine/nopaline dehydrogenase family protein [Saccharofermentanales bacterium]|jgi:opine dehydrogenase
MKITVIGAGNSGLAMAGQLAIAGHDVILWNRTDNAINKIMQTKTIYMEGVIEGKAILQDVTSDLSLALTEPELVMITPPAFAHKELAISFSEYLQSEPLIILSPGRTCGAIEFRHYYNLGNNPNRPLIAEAQTVIHTCRKLSDDLVYLYAIKDAVYLSGLGIVSNEEIYNILPPDLKLNFRPADSMIQTSIGNVGMILHCAPLLLNSGRTEDQYSDYLYYHEGITPRIAEYLEGMDRERMQVALALDYEVESTSDWLERSYQSPGSNLYEKIQNTHAYSEILAPSTLKHRYIFEDIPYGLVPLEALGHMFDIDMSYTSLIIDLGSKLMHENFRENGRNLRQIDFVDFFQRLVRKDDAEEIF